MCVCVGQRSKLQWIVAKLLYPHKVTLRPATVPPNVHLPFSASCFLTNGEAYSSVPPQTILWLIWLQPSCLVPSFTTVHGFPPSSLLVALSLTRKVFFQVSHWTDFLSLNLCPEQPHLLSPVNKPWLHPLTPNIFPHICWWPNMLPHRTIFSRELTTI